MGSFGFGRDEHAHHSPVAGRVEGFCGKGRRKAIVGTSCMHVHSICTYLPCNVAKLADWGPWPEVQWYRQSNCRYQHAVPCPMTLERSIDIYLWTL